MTATTPSSPRLLVRNDAGSTTEVSLEESATIGRDDTCTVCLPQRDISRRHARVFREDDKLFIEDLLSYNGVRVNGHRISGAVPLKVGDRIEIGGYILWIEAGDPASGHFDAPTVRIDKDSLEES